MVCCINIHVFGRLCLTLIYIILSLSHLHPSQKAGLRSPPAVYLTQRIEDTEFTSVFISDADMDLTSIDGVEGKSLAFGSASSTSGHLMPQYYLTEADVTPSSSIFTGSHDATIDAVMNGTTQTGALNSVVWFNRLAANTTGNTSVFYTTPQFVDYLWVAGAGITDKWASIEGDPSSVPGCEDINGLITEAFLSATNETAIGQALFAAYSTVGYVAITKGEYDPIEETGCQLDMIEKQYCDEPIPENLGNVGSDNSTTSAEPEGEDETEYFDPEDGTEDIEFTDPPPDVNATVTPVPDDDSVSSGITAKDFSAVLFSVSTIVATAFF